MTGTIRSLDVASASGVITIDDGLLVGFCPAAVLAYDAPGLAIGQVVSFDLDGGKCPKALNVCVQRKPQGLNGMDKRLEATRLRYIGFEHRGNIRAYLFEGLTPGAKKRTFAVDADLALFARHHVNMQEGPALCLHLLAAELDLADAAVRISCQCSLTDREMLAHVASRPAPRTKSGLKHTPPPPAATA